MNTLIHGALRGSPSRQRRPAVHLALFRAERPACHPLPASVPSMDAARAFRDELDSAATRLRPAAPVRFLAKRKTPLTRQGELLGFLEVLLRLRFVAGAPSQGVLVFEWPLVAASHSAMADLERWSHLCGKDGSATYGELQLERRAVTTGPDGRSETCGTHLKVRFTGERVPDRLLELLRLAVHVRFDQELRRFVRFVEGARYAASAPRRATRPTAEHRRVTRTEEAADRAKVDALRHNDLFDARSHPAVGINEEVTNSDGVTFRLVVKRVDRVPRRVWIRVSSSPARR